MMSRGIVEAALYSCASRGVDFESVGYRPCVASNRDASSMWRLHEFIEHCMFVRATFGESRRPLFDGWGWRCRRFWSRRPEAMADGHHFRAVEWLAHRCFGTGVVSTGRRGWLLAGLRTGAGMGAAQLLFVQVNDAQAMHAEPDEDDEGFFHDVVNGTRS